MSSYWAAAALIFGALFQQPPTISDEFASLNQQAHAARQSGDRQAYLSAALQMQKLLNESPASIKSVARAYAAAGDLPDALEALSRFADQGQSDDSLSNPEEQNFAALHTLPAYKAILDRLAANKTPIARAETAFLLPDPGLVAEDIAYDPQSKTFLISSIREKKVLRITLQGKATDFAQSPSHWPIFALKIDASRHLVWATESAPDGFTIVPKSDWSRSALLCFDQKSGALLRRIEGPAHTALGDMTLTEAGDPIVTDGQGGEIYRLAGDHLQLVNGRDFLSPQTPAMLPDGARALVPDYLRGIGILDLKSGKTTWLHQPSGPKTAINGADGAYLHHQTLVLTQNGTSPERILRLQLDKALTTVLSSEVIEQATPTLGDPTHGVFVGDTFYYIANSGWSELNDDGSLKPGSTLTPARIMRLKP